jgi:uncharacterized membrane protein YtjA (UPF0391 family)
MVGRAAPQTRWQNAAAPLEVSPKPKLIFKLWRNRRSDAAFHRAPRASFGRERNGEFTMGNLLHYALVFLVVALIAAAVGFGGVAGFAMEAARLLFWVFIVLFVVSLVVSLVRRA